MYTNFGGCGYFGFGDIATFKNGKFSAQKVHANRVLLFFNLFSMSLRNTCMLLNLNNFKILYYYNAAQNLQDKMIENWPFLKVVISPKPE